MWERVAIIDVTACLQRETCLPGAVPACLSRHLESGLYSFDTGGLGDEFVTQCSVTSAYDGYWPRSLAGFSYPSRRGLVSVTRHVAAWFQLPRHVAVWFQLPVTSRRGFSYLSRRGVVSVPRHIAAWFQLPQKLRNA